MNDTLQFKYGNELTEANGTYSAKEPLASELEYGEIIINNAKGYECIFFKNSDNQIVKIIANEQLLQLITENSIHISDINNPHRVIKSQLGLGSVDNTSDINKPVNTALRTALLPKISISDIYNQLSNPDQANLTVVPLSAAQGKVLYDTLAPFLPGGNMDETIANISNRISVLETELGIQTS